MPTRHMLNTITLGSLILAGTSACATKGFVRGEVTNVNQRVETLSQSLETTQESIKQNQQRIAEVDKKTEQAGLWARDAQTSAVTAQSAATAAADQASAANAKIEAVDAASRRLVYEVVINEDEGNFKFGSAKLPAEVAHRIDQMVADLKENPRGNFVEIEGHTDSVGNSAVNHRIGQERAEAVRRYLYEQHQVPLHKINVISYGEDKPVAPNTTSQGRAQNRRIVIRVLA